jgi:hypothetical protein
MSTAKLELSRSWVTQKDVSEQCFEAPALERTQSETTVVFPRAGFASNGTLQVDGIGSAISYTYTVTQDNNNERTLAGFSTSAQEKMFDCPYCPYSDYLKFRDYYDVFDYANQWVQAAFSGGKTSFKNGNADFGEYNYEGRSGELIQCFFSVFFFFGCAQYLLHRLSLQQRPSRKVLLT